MKQLLLLVLIVSNFGCGEEQRPTRHVVDVLGIDYSLSVKDFVLPDSSDVAKLISARTTNGEDYTLAIGSIGAPSDKPLMVLHVNAMPSIDVSAAPSIRKRQRRAIDSIRLNNDGRILTYLQSLQRAILDLPVNATLSSINEFNRKAATLISEPTFRNGATTKSIILISDCEQDSTGRDGDVLQNPFSSCPPFTLYLIGCKHADAFARNRTEQFQSFASLLLYLQQPPNALSKN